MLRWGADRCVALHFIDLGRPTQNPNIESLNGNVRDEFLNMHGFTTIFEARCAGENWRTYYSEFRPHSHRHASETVGEPSN